MVLNKIVSIVSVRLSILKEMEKGNAGVDQNRESWCHLFTWFGELRQVIHAILLHASLINGWRISLDRLFAFKYHPDYHPPTTIHTMISKLPDKVNNWLRIRRSHAWFSNSLHPTQSTMLFVILALCVVRVVAAGCEHYGPICPKVRISYSLVLITTKPSLLF